jgi:hypothetical protein
MKKDPKNPKSTLNPSFSKGGTEGGFDFAGFADWVEIFAGGKQTDSAGNVHDGDALIEKAVSTFDPQYHEPPAVVGHPAHDAPAYGWVEGLKVGVKDGVKRLYAKFKQVVPEFEDLVMSGKIKKRSASFYPDGRLRHVGWLGAMPPAVKGLADVKFSGDDRAICFETTTSNTKEKAMKFNEFMEVLKFWKKVQDDPDADIPDLTLPAGKQKTADAPAFSEADLEAARAEAAKAAKEEAEKAVRAEFAEAEARRRKAEVKAKIDAIIADGVKNGKIAPAWKDAGIGQFMEALDAQAVIEFGDASTGSANKKTGLDWFISFLEGLPKLINFDEIATRDKDVKTGSAGAKLDALVAAKRKENKELSYSAAFMEAMRENPALAQEYQQEMTA